MSAQLDLAYGTPEAQEQTGAAVRAECKRRLGNRDHIRILLSDGQWHSNSELHAIGGFRYGARILELRQGFGRGAEPVVIHAINLGGGLFKFQLDASRTVTEGCSGPCCIAREAGTKVPS